MCYGHRDKQKARTSAAPFLDNFGINFGRLDGFLGQEYYFFARLIIDCGCLGRGFGCLICRFSHLTCGSGLIVCDLYDTTHGLVRLIYDLYDATRGFGRIVGGLYDTTHGLVEQI